MNYNNPKPANYRVHQHFGIFFGSIVFWFFLYHSSTCNKAVLVLTQSFQFHQDSFDRNINSPIWVSKLGSSFSTNYIIVWVFYCEMCVTSCVHGKTIFDPNLPFFHVFLGKKTTYLPPGASWLFLTLSQLWFFGFVAALIVDLGFKK